MSFPVILTDMFDKSSPDFKHWSAQSSSSKDTKQLIFINQRRPKRKLTRYEEYILTLVRLHLALTKFLLGGIFGVSTSKVSQIFNTWINYIAFMFTPLLKWPSQNVIKRFLPGSFRLSFPNVTGIIDCTEFIFFYKETKKSHSPILNI